MEIQIFLCALFAFVGSSPVNQAFVKWMEITKANKLPSDFTLSYEPYDSTWGTFKKTYGKLYKSEEEHNYRQKIFMDNIAYIEAHNAKYSNGLKSFYLGINHFADWKLEEFQQYNGFRMPDNLKRTGSTYLRSSFVSLPDKVDWREHGYVTPVKNQGRCGSCWSFSATGSLEGQHYKKAGRLVSLSEQQLVDCSNGFGNHGCNGGLMDNAFLYIKEVGGIDNETYYPYEAVQEQKCNFAMKAIAATCTGKVDIKQGSETELQHAVATVGPVSVAIDAGHRSFQLYQGGVYDEPECSSVKLDHGVLAVGYGTYQGDDYWLVKNSWGPNWGLNGYIRMSRNKDNQCGIATVASYPLV